MINLGGYNNEKNKKISVCEYVISVSNCNDRLRRCKNGY